MSKDSFKQDDTLRWSEGCVLFLIVVTLILGYFSFLYPYNPPYSYDSFSLTVAVGIAAISMAIIHLARVLQSQSKSQ